MHEATMRIGEVARRTGLTPETIRAWQRRYGLLSPVRSSGSQRLYSDADVGVLTRVTELVADGWALAAAADHASAGAAQASGATDAGETTDQTTLAAVYRTMRVMVRAESAAEVVAVVVDLIRELGGDVGPAAVEGADVLPVDVSLGEGEPLLARAEPMSLARLRLEAVLPGLVEDARHMVAVIRRGDVAGSSLLGDDDHSSFESLPRGAHATPGRGRS